MKKSADRTNLEFPPLSDTAAAGHHVSETIDWSSLASRIKNQSFLIPPVNFSGDGGQSDENKTREKSTKSEDPWDSFTQWTI